MRPLALNSGTTSPVCARSHLTVAMPKKQQVAEWSKVATAPS